MLPELSLSRRPLFNFEDQQMLEFMLQPRQQLQRKLVILLSKHKSYMPLELTILMQLQLPIEQHSLINSSLCLLSLLVHSVRRKIDLMRMLSYSLKVPLIIHIEQSGLNSHFQLFVLSNQIECKLQLTKLSLVSMQQCLKLMLEVKRLLMQPQQITYMTRNLSSH